LRIIHGWQVSQAAVIRVGPSACSGNVAIPISIGFKTPSFVNPRVNDEYLNGNSSFPLAAFITFWSVFPLRPHCPAYSFPIKPGAPEFLVGS